MRKVLGPLAFAAFIALAVSPVVAQTQPDASARPTAVADRSQTETGASKRRAARVKHLRHAHGVRRHRTARHHRNRWRDVWVYSYDRHGYRHYEYVRRKFGGYFARGRADCACRRGSHLHYRAHHAHL